MIYAGTAPANAAAVLGLIDGELDALAADGPTDDEIERGRVQAEAQFVFRLQSVGGFGGKSDQLNAYNVFRRDPAYFDRDLARYQRVTKTSLQDAVRRYLANTRRVALSVVPRGRTILGLSDSIPAQVS
jgi:zinc protease